MKINDELNPAEVAVFMLFMICVMSLILGGIGLIALCIKHLML